MGSAKVISETLQIGQGSLRQVVRIIRLNEIFLVVDVVVFIIISQDRIFFILFLCKVDPVQIKI